MSLLTLDKLSVFRGDCPVVDTVSLALEPGDFIGLIGPNGAGKTTTMRILTGFLKPSSGSIKINGLELFKNLKKAREFKINDLIIDPGFGFGKTLQHNFEILSNLHHFDVFYWSLCAKKGEEC